MASNAVANRHAARKEVAAASELIASGDSYMAIPRLMHTISKYPKSGAALEARYFLGLAYYRLGGYRDAIDMFKEYERLDPQGRYVADSVKYAAKLTETYDRRYPSAKELNAKIADVTQKLEAAPDDLNHQWRLAGLLWKRGDYDNAGSLYKGIVDRTPQYANNKTIRERIDLLPNGEYTVLSPGEVQRRQAEAQPLLVINQASFRAGRDADFFARTERDYVVTGQVLNRGDSVLYDVEVTITLFGVGNIVYDTRTVRIGRLNPTEIRAFSARFRNFENIENVNRYDCAGSFRR